MEKKIQLQRIIQSWREFAISEISLTLDRNYSLSFSKDLVNAIIGVRRSGKTTIAIQQVATHTQQFLFMNFEDPFFSEYSSYIILDDLLDEYFNIYNENPKFIIFDEIHNIKNWERWVRKFIDQKKGFLVITGSSSKLLNSELSTSLTGRNLTKEVWPLSFAEYLQFLNIKKENFRSELINYLKWGGFPRITLESNEKLKTELLRQYYSDTTLKDVINRNQIRDVSALLAIFTFYLSNISSLHSYNSIKNAFNISINAAISYTRALVSAFLIFEVKMYSKNLKIQSRNPIKIYTIDTGFRNINGMSSSDDQGKLLENFVFLELKKQNKEIYYHREKYECDFVITEHYKPVQLIQVTTSLNNKDTYEREINGLREAMMKYKINEGLIITLNDSGKINISEGIIRIVPAWSYFS